MDVDSRRGSSGTGSGGCSGSGVDSDSRRGSIRKKHRYTVIHYLCDFGDFGVSYVATVAGRYTRRGGPRLSVQGEPLVVLTRGP